MPRIIAIDLGSHAVKATVLRTAGRATELEEQVSARVRPAEDAVPTMEDRLAALETLLEDHKDWSASGNLVGLAWPSDHATLHPLTLPFTDKAQVEKTLPFAVEGEVPFEMDQMHLAWRVVEVTDETRTLVALARISALRATVERMRELRVDPRTMYVTGELLGSWAEPDRVVAVVDVGHASTTVALAVHGSVQRVRVVGVGGLDFARALAGAMDLTLEGALAVLQGGVLPGPAGEDAATDPGVATRSMTPEAKGALDGAMGLLLAEIRSTLIAFEDALGLEVDEVALTGGAAGADSLAGYLRQDLGVPVRTPVDRQGTPVSGPYAVSHALALAVGGKAAVDAVDLRTGAMAFRGGIDVTRAIITYGAVLLAFFAVATLVTFVVQTRSMSKELEALDADIVDIVVENFPDVPRANVRDGTVAKAIMRERTDDAVDRAKIMGVEGGVPPTVDMLTRITEAFPPPDQVVVDVRELSITRVAVTMKAETDGYGEVATIEESLQQAEKFRNAETKDPKKVRDKIQFTINIPLDDGAAEEVE